MERTRRLAVEERIKAALSLGTRFSRLRLAPRSERPMADPEELLRVTEKGVAVLEKNRVGAIVIGAVALAAHGCVRFTEDIDLGVSADLSTLRNVADALNSAGVTAVLRDPDEHDPPGGVIDVTGPCGIVQIVNDGGKVPEVIDARFAEATGVARSRSPLRIARRPVRQRVSPFMPAPSSINRAPAS